MTLHSGSQFVMVDDVGSHTAMADSGKVSSSLAMLALGLRQDSKSGRWNTHRASLRNLDAHFDECSRNDAFDGNAGFFQPLDLSHKMAKVLEEALVPLNSRDAFTVNTEVPPGSLDYRQFRIGSTGKAVVYRGGSGQDIPDVGLAQDAITAPIVYMVSAASMDLLEEMRSRQAGLDHNTRKMSRARRAIMELQNKWTWHGAPDYGIYGLLNHPFIDTAIGQVAYNGSSVSDELQDLYFWADYAQNASGGAFRSDTLLISQKLYNALTGHLVPDTNGSNVIEMLKRHKPHITTVVAVRELDDAGGPGIHAMAFERRGGATDGSAQIISAMEPTMLPEERGALSTRIFMLAGFGGLNVTEVGSMVTVYVSGV